MKLFENLKSSDSKSPVVRELAARAHHRLGHLQIDSREYAASAENFRKTIALLKLLAADDPNNAEFECQLAEASANFGRLRANERRFADAEALLKSAIGHAERALRLDPDNLGATTRLAWPHGDLGRVYAHQGHTVEAIRFHRKEIDLRKSVVAKPLQYQLPQASVGDGRGPANWNNRLYLAAAHVLLAGTYADSRDYTSATDELSIALEMQNAPGRERPTDYLSQSRVMAYHLRRAGYCLRLKVPPYDPLQDIDAALQVKVHNPGLLTLAASIVTENMGSLRVLDENRKGQRVLDSIRSRLTTVVESP